MTGARVRAAVAALLAALLVGCAADGPPGEEEQARDTVQGLLSNCARGAAVPVLTALTEPARDAFAAGGSVRLGCDVVLKLAEGATDAELREIFERAEVVAVRVEGGLGDAAIRAPDGRTSVIELEVVRGLLYVTNTPLPSPAPTDPEGEVRAAVDELLGACARGDRAAVRRRLAPAARARFDSRSPVIDGCEAVLELAPGAPDPALNAVYEASEVTDVAIQGERATTTVRTPGGSRREVELERTPAGRFEVVLAPFARVHGPAAEAREA